MKLIIAGSRHYNPIPLEIQKAVGEAFISWDVPGTEPLEVVCGMARGVDLAGKAWADAANIPVSEFPANWNKYGKSAGPIRNAQMGDYADALLAFRFQNSRGTQHMIFYMKKIGKPVYIVECSP